MGSKRPYSAVDSTASEGRFSQHKKRKNNKTYEVKDNSINSAKKRARTIERRLNKGDDLPADVQQKLEREMAALQRRVEEVQGKKLRQKMIGKYHMVRFFEKRKAQRLQKQLRKRLEAATDSDEAAQIKKDIHICEVDISYTVYFPYLEPYISLYPRVDGKSESTDDEKSSAASNLHTERPALWTVVEKAMEEGTPALERLRDRRPKGISAAKDSAESHTKNASTKPKRKGPTKREDPFKTHPDRQQHGSERYGRGHAQEEEANETDGSDGDGGGFFEDM